MWTVLFEKGLTIFLTGSVLAFVEFLIRRHDDRKDKKDGVKATLETLQTSLADIRADIDKRFKKSEKDALRTQLLVMIYFRPEEQQEILTVAERYFVKLEANWYMTGIFSKWCAEHGLKPDWFKEQ